MNKFPKCIAIAITFNLFIKYMGELIYELDNSMKINELT